MRAAGPGAALAAFVAEAELPPRLLAAARRCVLDTLAVAVYGAAKPWSRAAAGVAARCGRVAEGGATVIGAQWRANATAAAFANGSAAHAFELDDVHDESIHHPGAVVVPAALALAEERGASGRAFLEAGVMGYEAMSRAGLAVGPSAHMLGGFHPTGTCGVFGSAAAAARLLGFDAGRVRDAFGIAASFAGGLMEFAASGGEVKRVHAGRAAEGGLTAALLAAEGLAGPSGGLDGRFGFCRTFSTAPEPERLAADLGSRFMIEEITVKPYASCSDVHPIIDALLAIRERDMPVPAEIEAIEIDAPTKVAEQNTIDGTASVMAAQYSAAFSAAAALLLDPGDPGIYRDETLADPAMRELQRCVAVRASAELDATYAWKIGAEVTVRMRDGREFRERVIGARGSIHRPLTDREVEHKSRTLLEAVGADGDRLVAAVAALEEMPSVVGLAAVLSPPVAIAQGS